MVQHVLCPEQQLSHCLEGVSQFGVLRGAVAPLAGAMAPGSASVRSDSRFSRHVLGNRPPFVFSFAPPGVWV